MRHPQRAGRFLKYSPPSSLTNRSQSKHWVRGRVCKSDFCHWWRLHFVLWGGGFQYFYLSESVYFCMIVFCVHFCHELFYCFHFVFFLQSIFILSFCINEVSPVSFEPSAIISVRPPYGKFTTVCPSIFKLTFYIINWIVLFYLWLSCLSYYLF